MNLPKFGVQKPVPVNMLMFAIILAGIYCAFSITREFFPDITPEQAMVTLPYPGATPEEVEESLAIKVEDAIADIDEVDEIRATIAEGGAGITVKFFSGVDVEKAVDEVERAIDALQDLPDESEEIQVVEYEPKLPVIMITLYGDADEEALKQGIQAVRDDLKTLPGMGELLVSGTREYEIRVDVSYEALLRHGISLPEVAASVRTWMREMPGGTVRTGTGNINVRTLGVPERAAAIRDIVLKADASGAAIRVGDIGSVHESFVDEQLIRRFNRKNAVTLTVFKTGDQDAVEIAGMVRAYVAARRGEPFVASLTEAAASGPRKAAYDLGLSRTVALPGEITTHSDLARFIEGRLDLLTRNAFWGAILVFATLFLFLNWRVAWWVGVGLVTALCGTLLIMKITGVTLNLLTMFGLIVVLGILVDDAIVVAENIQHRHDQGEPALQSAIAGSTQVFWPVVVTVLTTVVAFIPLRFVQGQIGDLLGALPMVVACALMMSLVESLLILPSHMGHSLKHRDRADERRGGGRAAPGVVRFLESKRDSIIYDRIVPAFGRFLTVSLRYRYISAAVALATLIGSVGIVAGGRLAFTFLPDSDSETIVVDVRMPIGIPIEETEKVVKAIENAALAQQSAGVKEVKSVSSIIGETQNLESGARDVSATHVAQMFIELIDVQSRDRESAAIIDAIRRATRDAVADADTIKYSEISGGPGGADITIELRGAEQVALEEAVLDVKNELRRIRGVYEINDDNYVGQRELQIVLKPGAAALGFTNENVAMQVRGALYGIDAHTFAERREDIDVRVRLDEATRSDLAAVENLWLVSPLGRPVPLAEVADLREGASYATIKRINRQRAITVTAEAAPGANPEAVMAQFPLAQIAARHPRVLIETGGRQKNLQDAVSTLPFGFAAALLMIYVLLAWLFSSYTQPIAVMLAIPFGIIGVIWGHFLLRYDMTFLSLIGFVALSGIVVNDSLILVEFYNRLRDEGKAVREALVEAGMRRLRPIFLTTITTVLGLTPLMLEQSFQAKFLIPMAIAISFGLMSSTVLILMVLPCIIVIIDDVKRVFYYCWHGRPRPEREHSPRGEIMTAE